VCVCACVHTQAQACVRVCASRVQDVCPSRVCAGWGGGGGDTTHRSMVWVSGARVVHLEAPALHCGGDAPLACACHIWTGEGQAGVVNWLARARVCVRACVCGAWPAPHAIPLHCVCAHISNQSIRAVSWPGGLAMRICMGAQCMHAPPHTPHAHPTALCTHDSPACPHYQPAGMQICMVHLDRGVQSGVLDLDAGVKAPGPTHVT
jgi:hypothetical protein